MEKVTSQKSFERCTGNSGEKRVLGEGYSGVREQHVQKQAMA